MSAVLQMAPSVGTKAACANLGLSRATVYRRRRPKVVAPSRRQSPHRRLNQTEREAILQVLHEPRFVDQTPQEIYATLLDEGIFLCSIRTMYRLLANNDEVKERRNITRHHNYTKPELLATEPNQVWSWDITKLLGPVKWTYFYLYVIMDIFSRRVVGWRIADCESAELFTALFEVTVEKYNIPEGQLTLHSDRGAPMTAISTAQLLANLGVTRSLSRPYTSNDNPFSEAQFKTMKYQPEFPDRFGCIEDAEQFCREYFQWYNSEHHHSGLGLMTPNQVHYGQVDMVYAARQAVLNQAYHNHPERFVNQPPSPPDKPVAAWINPPKFQKTANTDQERHPNDHHLGKISRKAREAEPFAGTPVPNQQI